MKPISIHITRLIQQSPQEICAAILDTDRWSEFEGYSLLPGIASARFETRTPNLVGSRIRVQNKDGSSHVEEIVEWEPERKIALRFQEFTPPLKYLATRFIETWEFRPTAAGVEATRSMIFHPKNIFGWLMLLPISLLMKKAFEQSASKMS